MTFIHGEMSMVCRDLIFGKSLIASSYYKNLDYKYLGTGSGVISCPLNPLALSLGASSSAMCQEKITAQSGWSANSRLSSTTGICVPGMHLPIFSDPAISQT